LNRQGLDQYLKDDYLGQHSIFHSLIQSKQSLNISQAVKFQSLSCQPVHVKMDDMPDEIKGLDPATAEVTNKSPINFREALKESLHQIAQLNRSSRSFPGVMGSQKLYVHRPSLQSKGSSLQAFGN